MSTANRNVRLGVVYRGSIIHEEVLDRRIDVTVGLRAGSTVQIPAKEYPEFPDSIELLAIENNQYYLLVPSDPSARVSVRGTTEKSAAMTVRACSLDTMASARSCPPSRTRRCGVHL